MSTATKVVFIDLAYNYGTVYDDLSGAYARGFREGGVNGGKQELISALLARAARGEKQTPSRRLKEVEYLRRFN